MSNDTRSDGRPDQGVIDTRDLRRALGQFATGVTVITTRDRNGRRIGLTANSFTSLSLDPPLLLFCIANRAPSRPEFEEASHFAIHVLAADQHELSTRFATPSDDKFAGIDVVDGPGGVPLIDGVLARFVCRNAHRYDGGDHSIVIGEVEQWERREGHPLVFHSGAYGVTAPHPELTR